MGRRKENENGKEGRSRGKLPQAGVKVSPSASACLHTDSRGPINRARERALARDSHVCRFCLFFSHSLSFALLSWVCCSRLQERDQEEASSPLLGHARFYRGAVFVLAELWSQDCLTPASTYRNVVLCYLPVTKAMTCLQSRLATLVVIVVPVHDRTSNLDSSRRDSGPFLAFHLQRKTFTAERVIRVLVIFGPDLDLWIPPGSSSPTFLFSIPLSSVVFSFSLYSTIIILFPISFSFQVTLFYFGLLPLYYKHRPPATIGATNSRPP